MKKLVMLCLFLAISLPALAVEGSEVMYIGGTVPALNTGVVGRLDTTSATVLTFDHAAGKLTIPYADIESFDYSKEVTRHLGVLPAIGVGLVKMRKHRHYFRISYRGVDNALQVVVFEVPKHMPRTLQAVLQARARQRCKPALPCAVRTEADQ